MNEDDAPKIPKIAVIGLEGSGKTVLVTTLAKRLSQTRDNLIYLDPQGAATIRYVEDAWAKLQSGEWPSSTPPGELFELRWKMKSPEGWESELRLLDAPGQDLRRLFTVDAQENFVELPDHMQTLASYCREADIVLLLLNIRDFVGGVDQGRHIENQIALKTAMDYINAQDDKELAVIFTQMDVYEDMVNGYGGLNAFLMKEVSYIYGAHVHGKPTMTMTVAAVNDTMIKKDENGVDRRVPSPGFSSRGLNSLAAWLGKVSAPENGISSDRAYFDCVDVEVASAVNNTMNTAPARSRVPAAAGRGRPKANREPDNIEGYFKQYYLKHLMAYANFAGRIGRKEFWFYMLFHFLISLVIGVIFESVGSNVISGLWGLATFIPTMSVIVKRLHDTDMGFIWVIFPPALTVAAMVMDLSDLARNLFEYTIRRNISSGLLGLAGISAIVVLVFTLMDSQPGNNRFGPNPKSGRR